MAKHDKDRRKGERKEDRHTADSRGEAAEAGTAPATPGERLQDRAASGPESGGHAGGHEAGRAHGLPATVDLSLPATREELLARHADARRRRSAAPLDSEAFRAAADEIGRIEIRIAAIERDQNPPLV
jgi:hypothetical protein